MRRIILLLIISLLIFALISQGYGMESCPALSIDTHQCSLVFQNTSGSTIWLSNEQPTTKKEFTKKELETLGAIALAPHSSEKIEFGRWFSIYTRIAQTNDTFQLHYTITYRSCKQTIFPITLSMNQIEADQLEKSHIIAIDHIHGDVTQGSYRLCPHGKKPLWDKNEEQWFCKVHRRSQYEYVPVQTYMYTYLPDWLISSWYTKNPTYYNWYHANKHFWEHMKNYKAPWQTDWYSQWYQNAQAADTQFLHKPDQTTISYSVNPHHAYGLPEYQMDISTISAH